MSASPAVESRAAEAGRRGRDTRPTARVRGASAWGGKRRAGFRASLLLIAIAAGSACITPVALSEGGSRVLILRHAHHRPHTLWLGPVWCWVRYEGYGFDANAKACEYQLMNQAATLGGTLVVVEEMRVNDDEAEMAGAAYAEWPPGRDAAVSP